MPNQNQQTNEDILDEEQTLVTSAEESSSNSSQGQGDDLAEIKLMLEKTQDSVQSALEKISEGASREEIVASVKQVQADQPNLITHRTSNGEGNGDHGRVIEGVFNGQCMISDDGREFNVPPNYASKSKLVEGDTLKLTISGSGSFIYKQIGPIDREQLIAELGQDETTGQFYAIKDKDRWKLITASVTYYQGEPGDEVVIMVPTGKKSDWAAVDNVIRKN